MVHNCTHYVVLILAILVPYYLWIPTFTSSTRDVSPLNVQRQSPPTNGISCIQEMKSNTR